MHAWRDEVSSITAQDMFDRAQQVKHSSAGSGSWWRIALKPGTKCKGSPKPGDTHALFSCRKMRRAAKAGKPRPHGCGLFPSSAVSTGW